MLTVENPGIVRGFPYTAVVEVGRQCAGVVPWSTEGCVGVFNAIVDQRCEQQYPSGEGLYQCRWERLLRQGMIANGVIVGYFVAACDNSFVSFNLGG